ncbi:MAG: DUF2867 domain-containing protein [Telluria sp.]
MAAPIAPCRVPPQSKLAALLPDAHFFDCYELQQDFGERTALEIYLDCLTRTPGWVDALMSLRNRIVSRLGLKDLGALGALDRTKKAGAYQVGDRVGIFSLRYLSDEEVVLGDDDRHLHVQVSICKLQRAGQACVAVSTVVHVKNLLGRVYMLFVTPLHKRIVPAVLARAC